MNLITWNDKDRIVHPIFVIPASITPHGEPMPGGRSAGNCWKKDPPAHSRADRLTAPDRLRTDSGRPAVPNREMGAVDFGTRNKITRMKNS